MRRTFFILVAVFLYIYGKEAYLLVQKNASPVHLTSGSLSDIAVDVKSIPLQTTGDDSISRFTRIKQGDGSIFTVFNGVLFRYDQQGKLKARITDPAVIQIAEYLIDTKDRRLIVMGNDNDIHYYSFEGELLAVRKYQPESDGECILSAACHDGRIWIVREQLMDRGPEQPTAIARQIVEYDTSFVEKSVRDLAFAPVGRQRGLPLFCNPAISVSKDTGEVYVFAPSLEVDLLLQDTLFIAGFRNNSVLWNINRSNDRSGYIYPVTFASRIWIASYSDPEGDIPGYLFSYDQYKKESRLLKDGLKDDFFHTGQIRHLTPIDVFNETWYYTHEQEGTTTLYMVRLKA